MVMASGCGADAVVARLPPRGGECTIEKIAINAVMAGAPPEAMPLIISAIRAMSAPQFNLAGLNATTGSALATMIVNGPVRGALGLPYREACFGGMEGSSPSIGRAVRLVIRNVAGQKYGVTSKCVFGQPGLVTGIVVAEWEERSPWAPLAERRGVSGSAVTMYGSTGTTNIADHLADNGNTLLKIIGKGMAHVGANGVALAVPGTLFAGGFVAINPVWAAIIARDVGGIEDVQALLWEHASVPVDYFPEELVDRVPLLARYRNGRVHLANSPEDILVVVCGGPSSIHAVTLASWGDTRAVTCAVEGPE